MLAVIVLMGLSADIARKRADGRILVRSGVGELRVFEVHERPTGNEGIDFWLWYFFGKQESVQYWVKINYLGGHLTASSMWPSNDDPVDTAHIEHASEEAVTVRFEPYSRMIVFKMAPPVPEFQ